MPRDRRLHPLEQRLPSRSRSACDAAPRGTAGGAAAGGAMGSMAEKQLSAQKQMVEGIHQVADNTRPSKSY